MGAGRWRDRGCGRARWFGGYGEWGVWAASGSNKCKIRNWASGGGWDSQSLSFDTLPRGWFLQRPNSIITNGLGFSDDELDHIPGDYPPGWGFSKAAYSCAPLGSLLKARTLRRPTGGNHRGGIVSSFFKGVGFSEVEFFCRLKRRILRSGVLSSHKKDFSQVEFYYFPGGWTRRR